MKNYKNAINPTEQAKNVITPFSRKSFILIATGLKRNQIKELEKIFYKLITPSPLEVTPAREPPPPQRAQPPNQTDNKQNLLILIFNITVTRPKCVIFIF